MFLMINLEGHLGIGLIFETCSIAKKKKKLGFSLSSDYLFGSSPTSVKIKLEYTATNEPQLRTSALLS